MRIWPLILVTAACTTHDSDTEFYGRPWEFTVVDASVPMYQPNGAEWDPDSSPPDPYAQLFLDGSMLGATPTIDDTYDPIWNFQFPPVVIEEGNTLSIDLKDSDDFTDDYIFRGCDVDLDSTFVKAGGTNCNGLVLSVSVI